MKRRPVSRICTFEGPDGRVQDLELETVRFLVASLSESSFPSLPAPLGPPPKAVFPRTSKLISDIAWIYVDLQWLQVLAFFLVGPECRSQRVYSAWVPNEKSLYHPPSRNQRFELVTVRPELFATDLNRSVTNCDPWITIPTGSRFAGSGSKVGIDSVRPTCFS
jgi:hypothetical protein